MPSGITNRGKTRLLEMAFRGTYNSGAIPSTYKLHLITDAVIPSVDTNTLSELTQIANGNGYDDTGYTINRDAVDFDVLTEDDTADLGKIQLKDIVHTASGGTLPASGAGASYMVLCDPNATLGSREVIAWFDLGGARQVSDGQALTIQDSEMRMTTPV